MKAFAHITVLAAVVVLVAAAFAPRASHGTTVRAEMQKMVELEEAADDQSDRLVPSDYPPKVQAFVDSVYHFCRAFKTSFGVPPHRYHNIGRIEHAKSLLAKTACSVTEIGLMIGYSETSSFTAAFRRMTGSTPTAYRRSVL
jgi:methylphosphotriester-DNA--protein-cysteine methyltransferase